MSTTNSGNQTLTFDYKNPTTSASFNTLLRGAIKPGIFSGATLTKVDNATVTISPFVAYLNVGTDKMVRATTTTAVTINVSAGSPVVYMTYTWADVIENYIDFAIRADNGVKATNEVTIGKATYSGSVLTGFNYTWPAYKTSTSLDSANTTYLPGNVRVNGTISGSLVGNVTGNASNNVALTGNQTIAGTKTFSSNIVGTLSGSLIGDITGHAHAIAETGTGAGIIREKIINIDDWDMASSGSLWKSHGLTFSKIRSASCFIRDDAGLYLYDLVNSGAGEIRITATGISLYRIASFSMADTASFDSTLFNSTSYNRGFITIRYID
jgi:hypothetical protein